MDIGNGPMIYKTKIDSKTRWVVATGDKQGNWYVFDAKTGVVLNGLGLECLLPGPPVATSSGGFNLQSAFFKHKGSVRSIGNLLSSYNLQICNTSGGVQSQCVRYDFAGNYSAHIVAISGDGLTEIDRFTRNGTHFLGGLVIANKMVFVRDAFNKKLLVLDATDLNNILHEHDLSAHLSGGDLGAFMALGGGNHHKKRDDIILVGTGIFGSATGNGMIALGLPTRN